MEADFRFALVRLRENAEGIALYKGERDEAAILSTRFGAIIVNFRRLMARNRLLDGVVSSYGELAGIIPWLVATPLYFLEKVSFVTLSRVADSFGEVQRASSWIVDNYGELAEWAANVERLATFRRALAEIHIAGAGGVHVALSESMDLTSRNLRLELPDGTILIDNTALRFQSGLSTLIIGESGIGKSTLFRSPAGIWPYGSGSIQQPLGKTLFLPQRPYIPLGTLRQALCYPGSVSDYTEDSIRAALADSSLNYLQPKLDVNAAWSQRLSNGEQQRLAFARVLLYRPDWVFLDEATADLEPEGQADLYRVLRLRQPLITIVSISHAVDARCIHDRQFLFQRDGVGGSLIPLS